MTKTAFILPVFVALFCAAAAHADSISIDISPATVAGAPGDDVEFFGTITNNTSDALYLNDDTINLSALPPDALDGSPLLLNAPYPLGPGENTGSIELFDITIPGGFTSGNYDGSFDVNGGTGMSDDNLLGTGTFTLQVQPSVSSVPEPSFAPLLLLALLGLPVCRWMARCNIRLVR